MADTDGAAVRNETNIEIVYREPRSLIKSYMLNVTGGGIYIKTQTPLPLDALVLLKMSLPEVAEELLVHGSVVLINPSGRASSFPPGMGIAFNSMSDSHKELIDTFIAQHRKEIEENAFF